jgi:uncharacterized membrane protein
LTIPAPGAPAEAGGPPPGAGPASPFGPIEPPPGAASPSGPGVTPDAENPYASPADYTLGAPAYTPAPGAVVPTRIDAGDVFGRAWTIYKDQMLMCIGGVLIVGILNWLVSQILNVGSAAVGELAGEPAVALACSILAGFLDQMFALWLNIGLTLLFLNIARGRQASLGDIFQGGPFFLTALVATILVVLINLVGFLLLIIPGIIFALMLSQYLYLIVDRNVGILESLELSRQITHGNKLTIFVLWLLSSALIFLGLLMCCVGVVFTGPLVSLMFAVAYLAMTGQPTADQPYDGGATAPYAAGPDTSPFGPAPEAGP